MNSKFDWVTTLRTAMTPLLLCAIAMLSPAAHAAGVAMVTDLQGKATTSSDGRSRDLTILAELEAGAKVQLSAGATLVALYLAAGDEYVFKGPATIDFKPAAPEVVGGPPPERRRLTLGKGGKEIRIKPVGMTQGAMVMRSVRADARIQLLSLNRTRTLETQPVFLWKELQPGLKYEMELNDDTGRTIFEAQVDANSLKLPASIQMKEGVPYTWQVSARLPDGRKYSSSAEFALATADLRAAAETLRPAPTAPLSSRIAYAAWLDQMELKDEARKYWNTASAERPEDPRLKSLAGQ